MLTNQQVLFIHEYLKDNNAHQAALRAGYSTNSARRYAHTILRKPEVQQYLDEVKEKLKIDMGYTLEAVIAEYAKIAAFDVRKLFDKDGNLIPVQQFPADIAAITSLEIKDGPEGKTQHQRIRIKDRILALDRICKLLGFLDPKEDPKGYIINWSDNTGEW